MLVLSRREGEVIEFPELDISVRVMQLKKSKVQLGIDAPRAIRVERSETQWCRDEASGGRTKPSADQNDRKPSETQFDDVQKELEQRCLDELTKLEVEVMTLAELVDSNERDLARQTSRVSLERLAGLRNIVKQKARRQSTPRSISDFIRSKRSLTSCVSETEMVESEQDVVLKGEAKEHHGLRTHDVSTPRVDCLRQAGIGYTLGAEMPVFSE